MNWSYSPIIVGFALAFAVAVAAIDAATSRIPNRLTYPMAAVALSLNFIGWGAHGVVNSLAGGVLMLAIFIPLFLAGGFGAGDVKALAAVGLILGPQGAFAAAAWTLIAGAIGGLLVLLAKGGAAALQSLLLRWSLRAHVLIATGRTMRLEPSTADAAHHRFPYGCAIACGTAAALFWS